MNIIKATFGFSCNQGLALRSTLTLLYDVRMIMLVFVSLLDSATIPAMLVSFVVQNDGLEQCQQIQTRC